MSKKYKTPRFITILALTSITVFFWVGFEIYWALTRQPDIDVPAAILRPLNTELDLETLGAIDDTIYLTEQEIGTTSYLTGLVDAAEEEEEKELVEEATEEGEIATSSAQPGT